MADNMIEQVLFLCMPYVGAKTSSVSAILLTRMVEVPAPLVDNFTIFKFVGIL